MKLRLICCGLSRLPRPADEGIPGAYRLPRVLMARDGQQFLPDFALLLLADELLMDRVTFEGLVRGQILSGAAVPLLARLLQQEGFLQLEDMAASGRAHEPRLAGLLEDDLIAPESWVATVREWSAAWQSSYQGVQATLRPGIQKMRDAVAAGRPVEPDYSHYASKFIHDTGGRYQMAKFYAEESIPPEGDELNEDQLTELGTLLSEELRLARGNLMQCREFGAALHDWCDLEPFYRAINGRAAPAAGADRRLFELPLPEFAFWHPDNVLRALRDPRVRQLRERVAESIATGKPLAPKPAKEILGAIQSLDQGILPVRQVSATLAAAPKRGEQSEEAPVLLLTSSALGTTP